MVNVILAFVSAFVVLVMSSSFAMAQTADLDIKKLCASSEANKNSSLCVGYNEGASSSETDNPLLNTLTVVINLLSFIAGILAVIFVMYGGFKYIVSTGDAGKVTSAKNTILYALVGIVVVVISRLLILFILSKLL
jgi:hypothetical protein